MRFQKRPFDEVFSDESGGNIKTPTSEYLPSGQYPIIDQGQGYIAGYVNDPNRICGNGRPAIIFGDHTRCVKFVDFPFCMGADGVKVLRPKINADLKYLYHALSCIEIRNAGYDRHFKYLKRKEVPVPPLPEQRRIAQILDKAEALRAKRRAALAKLDTLAQSIFLEMFGDPAMNPKKWPVVTIRDLLESASYGTSEKSASSGDFPVIRMNNITSTGGMDFTDLKYMDLDPSMHDRYLVNYGDVLFNRTNSAELVGKSAIFRSKTKMAYAGYLVRLRVSKSNDPEYLSSFLNTSYSKRILRGMCKSIIGMANINASEIQKMSIPKPPLPLQQAFARRVEAIETLKAAHRASLAKLDALFASLQHRAFRGEL